MHQIATKWHKLMDAAAAGRISCMILDNDGQNISGQEAFDTSLFMQHATHIVRCPRFVISDRALALLNTDQAALSVADMVTCGVLGLPYTHSVIEFSTNNVFYNIYIQQIGSDNISKSWRCSAISYNTLSETDYAVTYPCFIEFEIENANETPLDTDLNPPPLPKITFGLGFEPFIRTEHRRDRMVDDAYPLMLARCFTGFVAAMLLPQTIGLDRDEVPYKNALNASRINKRKSEIPAYTLIRLHQAYEMATEGPSSARSVEVHLRRAHKKRVAFGAGRKQREWRFIPAQVVGHLPDGRKPTLLEMLATRAAKPYLLR